MMVARRLYIPLLAVSVEVATLELHLGLIEEQLVRSVEAAKRELESEIAGKTPADEDEWDIPHQLHDQTVEVTLPRILRNPFLVTLFSV